jgi:hypothetical protein
MATTCTPQALATASACLDESLPAGVREAIKTYLLAVQAGGSVNAVTLLAQARTAGWCADKFPPQDMKAAQIYMLGIYTSTTLQSSITLSKCFDLEPSSSKSAGTIYLLANGNSVSTNPSTLVGLATTNKFLCGLDTPDLLAIQSMLMATILGNASTPQAIMTSAACYNGIGSGLVAAIEEYLWCFFFNSSPPVVEETILFTSVGGSFGRVSATTGFYKTKSPSNVTTVRASASTFTMAAGNWQLWPCDAGGTVTGGFISVELSNSGVTAIDMSHGTSCTNLKMDSNPIAGNIDLTGCNNMVTFEAEFCPNATSLTLTGCTAMTGIYVYYSGWIHLDFRAATALQNTNNGGCSSLLDMDCSGLTNLSTVSMNQCTAITSYNFSGCTNLVSFEAGYNVSLTSINFTGCQNLQSLDLNYSSSLLSIDISPCVPSLSAVNISYCGISMSDTDGGNGMLIDLAAGTVVAGDFNFTSCPTFTGTSPAGGVAAGILTGRGWSVYN